LWFVFINKNITEGCPWQLTSNDTFGNEPDDDCYREFTDEEQAIAFLKYKKNLWYAREENHIIYGVIFIIPNPAKRYTSFEATYQKHHENFCKLNGIGCNLDSIWINIWGSFEGDASTGNNFSSYGVLTENGEKYGGFPEFLPYKLVENIKEGETLSFLVELDDRYNNIPCPNPEDKDYRKTIFEAKLYASQTKHRFARFGFFENAVRYAIKRLEKDEEMA